MSNTGTRPLQPTPDANVDERALKAVASWVQQLARTLKNARLYDAQNAMVVRFREELHAALERVLEAHGPVALRFTADDVFYEEVSLYPARSRDDNLALPFYRDGLRGMVLRPGIAQSELDAFVAAVLRVTGPNDGADDLVTLLWEAELPHLEIDHVPAEGDLGMAFGLESVDAMPWPQGDAEGDATGEAGDPGVAAESGEASVPETGGESQAERSDDWDVRELTVEVEAAFEELATLSAETTRRFLAEYEAEHAVSIITASVAVAQAFVAAGATAEQCAELTDFLPRVFRQATAEGRWLEAREALRLLQEHVPRAGAVEVLCQELAQPISVSMLVHRIGQQSVPEVEEFVALIRSLGPGAAEPLHAVLIECQKPRPRRLLTDALIELCREHPERLAPMLSDPRPPVVRTVVQVLGAIGGDAVPGLVAGLVRHPDPQVRYEIVQALGQSSRRTARPVLLALLEGADARTFASVLTQLSAERDAELASLLLGLLRDPEFERRAPEEKRAIYRALSAVGGDETAAELELEFGKGSWFGRAPDAHLQSVARCLARIGTPFALEALKRGAQSRRAPVRKACLDAISGYAE